jgi:hypothetical protein
MNNQNMNKRGAARLASLVDSEKPTQLRETTQSPFMVGSYRLLIGAVAVIAVAVLASVPVAGQVPSRAATAKAAAKTWTLPHTPDGHPDLQGLWSNATLTPLERPKEFEGKSVLTPEEATEYENRPKAPLPPVVQSAIFLELATKIIADRRTSLIIDPTDGRLPPLTPEAQKRVENARVQDRLHGFDSADSLGMWARCITIGLPMLPTPYNNSIQIVQAPGYVVVLREMIHEARIIPMDGRPHVPPSIRAYGGDPRGHWEGDTLVVDTTNFTGKYKDYPREGFTPGLHLIERFTRTDANTLSYEATVDDPTAFTKSWTVKFPMAAIETPVFEYGCHEGNYAMTDVLSGARADEKRAAEEAAKKGSK